MTRIYTAAITGLDARLIEVEVDLSFGLHIFNIVGLPDKAVEEAKERVSSAIRHSGIAPPQRNNQRLVVNLAPADVKKEGSGYDLPIALGYLLASKQISFNPENKLFIGELALDGQVRPVNGILSMALLAREKNIDTIFVPSDNAKEASLIEGIEIIPVRSLVQVVAHLEQRQLIEAQKPIKIDELLKSSSTQKGFDMAYIKGQEGAKRAIEIAASGNHNLLMVGPPGSGKSLLAKAISSILPRMSKEEILEVTKTHSVAGKLDFRRSIIIERPFRSPHHTASEISLIGGGAFSKPGEISLAHRGVLFLDELPEFHRDVLEALRQPLEEGFVTVSRARASYTYPARFMLVAAMNPCPCGYAGHPTRPCVCSGSQIMKYQRKLSGPLLDRIDIWVEVPSLKYEKLASEKVAEESTSIRKRVEQARKIQEQRFENLNIKTNSEMSINLIEKYCRVDRAGRQLLKSAVNKMSLSARAYHRILKLARTIADLDSSENILVKHLAEALQYRQKNNTEL